MASEILRRLIPEDIEDLNKKLKSGVTMLLILYSFLGYPPPAKAKPTPKEWHYELVIDKLTCEAKIPLKEYLPTIQKLESELWFKLNTQYIIIDVNKLVSELSYIYNPVYVEDIATLSSEIYKLLYPASTTEINTITSEVWKLLNPVETVEITISSEIETISNPASIHEVSTLESEVQTL